MISFTPFSFLFFERWNLKQIFLLTIRLLSGHVRFTQNATRRRFLCRMNWFWDGRLVSQFPSALFTSGVAARECGKGFGPRLFSWCCQSRAWRSACVVFFRWSHAIVWAHAHHRRDCYRSLGVRRHLHCFLLPGKVSASCRTTLTSLLPLRWFCSSLPLAPFSPTYPPMSH